MREYFAEWNISLLTVASQKIETDVAQKHFEELIPRGICSLAFITCYPYAWTFEHGGWFRWVPRIKPLIKWHRKNWNLSHEREVLVVCPNPHSHVLFGLSPGRGSTKIRVIEVKGDCPKKHVPGQIFHISHNDVDTGIFFQIYPYYCALATRRYQSGHTTALGISVSGPDGESIHLGQAHNTNGAPSSVCHNSKSLLESDFLLTIEELRMPCRYQRAKCSFKSRELKPMEEMCLDAAWAVYPSALATLYDARPKRGRFFEVSCPSGANRVIWEVRMKNRYCLLYTIAKRAFLKFFSYFGICIDRPDKEVKLCVKRIIGECPAGYRPGMEFCLNLADQSKLCPATFTHFYPLALQWLRGVIINWSGTEKSLRFSCPDVHGANYRLVELSTDDGKNREEHHCLL